MATPRGPEHRGSGFMTINLRIQSAATFFAAIVWTFGIVPDALAAPDGQKRSVKGIVTGVEATSLIIQDRGDTELTLHTSQDYSESVSVGMQVKAEYREQGGILKLDALDYPLEVSLAPPQEFLPRVHRIILLPSSNAGDASPLFDEIERLLRARFDWVIAHRMLATEVRRRALEEQGVRSARFPRGSGAAPEPLAPADPELIRRIAEGARADAVLEVRVEYILLSVSSYTAEWDGQRESFGTKRSRFASALTLRPVRGQIPVATVVLKLYDAQGRQFWRNRRGFRVLALQTGMGDDFRDRPLPEAAEDSTFLSEWLHQVFATWLKVSPEPANTAAKQ